MLQNESFCFFLPPKASQELWKHFEQSSQWFETTAPEKRVHIFCLCGRQSVYWKGFFNSEHMLLHVQSLREPQDDYNLNCEFRGWESFCGRDGVFSCLFFFFVFVCVWVCAVHAYARYLFWEHCKQPAHWNPLCKRGPECVQFNLRLWEWGLPAPVKASF